MTDSELLASPEQVNPGVDCRTCNVTVCGATEVDCCERCMCDVCPVCKATECDRCGARMHTECGVIGDEGVLCGPCAIRDAGRAE